MFPSGLRARYSDYKALDVLNYSRPRRKSEKKKRLAVGMLLWAVVVSVEADSQRLHIGGFDERLLQLARREIHMIL